MLKEITDTSILSYDPTEGFLRVTVLPDKNLDLKEAKHDFDVAAKMLEYIRIAVLVDSRKALQQSAEVRKFYASKEVAKTITAMAILIDSSATRLIANFFIQFSKPHFPTRLFNNTTAAEKWLKQFVK